MAWKLFASVKQSSPVTDSVEIQQALAQFASECYKLRFEVGSLDVDASPSEVMSLLLDARRRLDRIEELLHKTILVRGRLSRVNSAASVAAEEAWDEQAIKNKSRSTGVVTDYSGPRERYAESNLATLNERRAMRQAAELLSLANDSFDVIKLAHQGLDRVRQECLVLLRSLRFESSLEH